MLFSSSQGKLILIIDVQSSVVRGTLVHMTEGAVPSIIFTHNSFIPSKKIRTSGYLIKMALRGVEEVVRSVLVAIKNSHNSPELPRHISEVHYVLSSPWVVSQAKTITTVFKDEMAISRAYVSGLIWEERKKMASVPSEDVRVIEKKVFDVQLNGYSVASWESRKTRELGVSFVVSVAGGRMIDRFTEMCHEIIRPSHVHFHSSLFLQHTGVQVLLPDSTDYLLVHIHGELTDIAVIKNRACMFFGSYPIGINNITRTIAEELKMTEPAAESTLDLVVSKDVDSAKARKEAVVITNMKKGWLAGFDHLLKSSTSLNPLPRRVILSSKSHEEFFKNTFSEAHPTSQIETLSIELILPHVSYGPQSERLRLSGLYVIAVHTLSK